jgi:hypothetical protein
MVSEYTNPDPTVLYEGLLALLYKYSDEVV